MSDQPELDSFEAVILALGGVSAVGRLTNHDPASVTNWRRTRGKIPAKYYELFKRLLAQKGFTASPAVFGQVDENEDPIVA